MATFTNTVVLRWMEDSKITCVSWCYGLLYFGDESGSIYSFKSVVLNNLVETDNYNVIKLCKRKIMSITSFEPREELLVLDSDGNLYIVDLYLKLKPYILCKKVLCMAKQAVETDDDIKSQQSVRSNDYSSMETISPVTYMANICIGMKDKIRIYSAIGEKILHSKDINIVDPPLKLCWLNDVIVYGTLKSYIMINISTMNSIELCSNVAEFSDGVMLSICIDNDIMVICNDIGVFYNIDTMNLSQKNTIQWGGKLLSLGLLPPFIVGLTVHKKLEIYGIRDQVLYKRIDQSNIIYINYMINSCYILTCTSNIISLIQPCSYYDHLNLILQDNNVTEALKLINLYFSNSNHRRLQEIKICHTISGWINFRLLRFPSAFQHFSFGNVDLLHLLSFWNRYYPFTLPDDYQANSNIPNKLLNFIPESCNINQFIKDNIKDHESSSKLLELANRSFGIFLFKMLNKFEHTNDIATRTNEMNGVQSTNRLDISQPFISCSTTIGLADSSSNYLSLKSKATPRDRGEVEYMTSGGLDSFHLPTILMTVTLILLAECDDTRYNVILRNYNKTSLIDIEIAKKHLIDMNKCDVYAKLLISEGKLIDAMNILADLVNCNKNFNLPVYELAACINDILDSRKYKNIAGAEGRVNSHGGTRIVNEDYEKLSNDNIKEIILNYIPLLLKTLPSSGILMLNLYHNIIAIDILTRNHLTLPLKPNEVLDMIKSSKKV